MHSIRNCRRRRELGEQLLQCRMKRQWTLAQTSALINGQLTPETIERIELGKHSMNNIHIIAPLCDVYEKDFVFQLIDLPPEQIAARKKAAAEKRLADKLAKKEKKAQKNNKTDGCQEQMPISAVETPVCENADNMPKNGMSAKFVDSPVKDDLSGFDELAEQTDNICTSIDRIKQPVNNQTGQELSAAERECIIYCAVARRFVC